MTQKDLEELYIKTEHGLFTPNYTYEYYDVETETYIGLVINKTALQVYKEWLENKDKPTRPQITDTQRISDLEIKLMKLERGL